MPTIRSALEPCGTRLVNEPFPLPANRVALPNLAIQSGIQRPFTTNAKEPRQGGSFRHLASLPSSRNLPLLALTVCWSAPSSQTAVTNQFPA